MSLRNIERTRSRASIHVTALYCNGWSYCSCLILQTLQRMHGLHVRPYSKQYIYRVPSVTANVERVMQVILFWKSLEVGIAQSMARHRSVYLHASYCYWLHDFTPSTVFIFHFTSFHLCVVVPTKLLFGVPLSCSTFECNKGTLRSRYRNINISKMGCTVQSLGPA